MVSSTQKTERRRANKVKGQNRKRKNALANKGSTKTKEELFKIQG